MCVAVIMKHHEPVFDSVTRVWEVRSSFKARATEFNITFGETERETFNPDSL